MTEAEQPPVDPEFQQSTPAPVIVPTEEVEECLRLHRERVESKGKEGERVSFYRGVLTDAYLQGANLRGADFTQAILQGADLREANLQMAQVQDAKMAGAELDGAMLEKADFLDALGLTADQVQGAVIDARTRWPSSLRDEGRFESEGETVSAD